MSRTVCSWCKAPLVLKDDIFVCGNTDCPACDEKYLHEELIRTRKALDVARHTIGWINQMIDEHADKQAIKIKCEYAIDKITALEQKDVK